MNASQRRNNARADKDNPYVGPRTFEPEQKDIFFGRDREAMELRSRLLARRLVLFYSESGAGKSSLINARLIPELEKENGFEVLPKSRVLSGEVPADIEVDNIFIFSLLLELDESDVYPDRFANMQLSEFLLALENVDGKFYYIGNDTGVDDADLSDDIADSDLDDTVDGDNDDYLDEIQSRVLIIDQFEEIFTTHPEAWAKRKDFFRQISQAMSDDPFLYVLFSMREDYVARLAPYSHLLPNELRTRYYMQRMRSDAALQAIKNPAAATGYDRPYASGVAEKLRDNLLLVQALDQSDETVLVPGESVEPLQLQVVCHQLWEKLRGTEGNEITEADLARLVGPGRSLSSFIDGSLGDYYDQAVNIVVENSLETPKPVTEPQVRRWFSECLITEAGTRGFVSEGKEASGNFQVKLPNEVVAMLQEERLIRSEVKAGGVRWYELVHDRFVRPVQQSNVRFHTQRARQSPIVRQAYQWNNTDDEERQSELLLTGDELELANLHLLDLDREDPVVKKFLHASEEMAREQKLKRTQKQRQLLIALVALVLVLAVGASFGMRNEIGKRRQSDLESKVADSKRLANQAEVSFKDGNRDGSLLFGVEADTITSTLQTQEILLTALDDAFKPHGGRARLIEAPSPSTETASSWNTIALSPDGQFMVMGDNFGSIVVWDRQSESIHTRIPGAHDSPVFGLEYHPTLSMFASSGGDRNSSDAQNQKLLLWTLNDGEFKPQPLAEDVGSIWGLAFNRDGTLLAAGNYAGTVTVWDLSNSEPEMHTLENVHDDWVWSVEFSPVDDRLASSGRDANIVLWDSVTDEQPSHNLLANDHKEWVNDVAFSPDGMALVSAADDGDVRLWDLTSSRPTSVQLYAHTSSVYGGAQAWSIAFQPGGRLFATGGADNVLRIWDLEQGALLTKITTDWNGYDDLVFDSQNPTSLIAVNRDHHTPLMWEVGRGSAPAFAKWSVDQLIDAGTLIPGNAPSATLAVVRDDKIVLWSDATSPISGTVAITASNLIRAAAFNADGSMLAAIEADGKLTLWTTGNDDDFEMSLASDHLEVDERGTAVAFSPDGVRLAAAICKIAPPASESTQTKDTGIEDHCSTSHIRVWEVDPVTVRLDGYEDYLVRREMITDLTFGANANTLAWIDEMQQLFIGSIDSRLRDRRQLTPVEDNDAPIQRDTTVTFIPGVNWLVSGGCMWNPENGKCQSDYLQIWDSDERAAFGPLLEMEAATINDMEYSPNRGELIVLDQDDYVIWWNLGDSNDDQNSSEWRRLACEAAGRNLNFSEWQAAFSDDEYRHTCPDQGYGHDPSHALQELAAGDEKINECSEKAVKEAVQHYKEALRLAGDSVGGEQTAALIDDVDERAVRRLLALTKQRLIEGESHWPTVEECFIEVNNLLKEEQFDLDRTETVWKQLATTQDHIQTGNYQKALASIDEIKIDNSAPERQSDVITETLTAAFASGYEAICFSGQLEANEFQRACDELAAAVKDISSGEEKVSRTEEQSLWTFFGEKGNIVTIALDTIDNRFDPHVTLLGPEGHELSFDNDSGGNLNAMIADFILPQSGNYFIQVGPGERTEPYILNLHMETVAEITFGKEITSTTELNSFWVFDGVAREVVTIAMDTDDDSFDPYLTLVGPDGQEIVSDDDGGESLNSLIQDIDLPSNGRYIIQAGRSGSSAEYKLSLSRSVPMTITVGETVTNTTAVQSLWSFDGVRGDVVTIAMDTDDDTFDPHLTLVGPDGQTHALDDDGGEGLNALLRDVVLLQDGEYLIKAGYLEGLNAPYSLTLSEGIAPAPIALGESVTSTTQITVSWVFTGALGDIVTISLTPASEEFDPYLTLIGEDGTVLAENDDNDEGYNGYDAEIPDFELPANGLYYIRAGRPGSSEPYILSITEP